MSRVIFSSVCLSADHGGFVLQQQLFQWLRQSGVRVMHLGPTLLDPEDDYPHYAKSVARRIQQDAHAVGVLACRTGAGMSIVANRFPGVRAVVCRNEEDARLAREHNDANVLVLEGDHVMFEEAQQIFLTFVGTEFAEGRHSHRVDQIDG